MSSNKKDDVSFPYVLGALPSPPDVRDFKFSTRQTRGTPRSNNKRVKLPSTLDLRNHLPPVMSQGKKQTCTACVGACIKEYQERMDCNYDGYFSPDYIYFYRENTPYAGMWPRDMMKILQKRGCCTNYKLPYEQTIEVPAISSGCDRDAANYKVGAYYQLNSVEELKQALFENGPCCITFNVYNGGRQMWKQQPGDVYRGSHAMTVVGYKKDKFIIRNSWGKKWGNKGYTEYHFKDFGVHLELWTCVDQRGSSKIKYDTKTPEKKNKGGKSKFLCCC